MTHEVELAGAGALGGLMRWRRRKPHADRMGQPCANCATPLQGPWCHQCGQLGEDFHRSALHLAGEAVEGLFHLDGRLWRTLPDLALRPGRLTRAYLDGHRAPQIPPLRLFLVALLILFLAGATGGPLGQITTTTTDAQGHVLAKHTRPLGEMTPQEREAAKKQIANLHVQFGARPDAKASAWLQARLAAALSRPEEFKLVIESWGERFAFLMLPLSALLLSVLFVFQRRFVLFDHLVFSMHSLAFLSLLFAAYMLVRHVAPWAGVALLAAPVHLFFHLRGVYGVSVIGGLVRMMLLLLGSLTGFGLIVMGLFWVGLSALAPG